jgi:hypothetical protein
MFRTRGLQFVDLIPFVIHLMDSHLVFWAISREIICGCYIVLVLYTIYIRIMLPVNHQKNGGW